MTPMNRKVWLISLVTSVTLVCNVRADDESLPDAQSTELLRASGSGDVAILQELIQNGADVNTADKFGRTPLHLSTARGRTDVVRLLLDAGANPNAYSKDSSSILQQAVGKGREQIVSLLLQAGAKPDAGAMRTAGWLGRKATLLLLLEAGGDASAALGGASHGGHVESMKLLIGKDANLNAKNSDGVTPLHLAALQGGPAAVGVLLRAGADSNAVDNRSRTPLHMAVSGDCDPHCVKLLLDAGVRLDIADEDGMTPVRLAGERGAKDVYKLLLTAAGGKEPPPVQVAGEANNDISTAKLLEQLTSQDYQQRRRATRQLAMRSSEVVPEIIQRLENGADIQPYHQLLEALGPAAEQVIPLLVERMTDKQHVFGTLILIERMRPGAIAGLDKKTLRAAAHALGEVVVDPEIDSIYWSMAARMLVVIGEPAVPEVLKLLNSDKPGFREGMAERLWEAGERGWVKRLRGTGKLNPQLRGKLQSLASNDPVPAVRAVAGEALVMTGNGTASTKEALLEILKSPAPEVDHADPNSGKLLYAWQKTCDRAARALAEFGPEVIDDLVPLLTPMNSPNRSSAITALRNLGPPAISKLVKLLESDDRATAIAAVIALKRIGPRSVEQLTRALAMCNEAAFPRICSLLGGFGSHAKLALPDLHDAIRSQESPVASRVAAAGAAFQIDPFASRTPQIIQTVVPLLMNELKRDDYLRQGAAARTLGAIGPEAAEALPVLRELLGSVKPHVAKNGIFSNYLLEELGPAVKAVSGEDLVDGAARP